MTIPQKKSTTPKKLRDRLETPPFVYWWISQVFKFDVDLAADQHNAKCSNFFTAKDNALIKTWHSLHDRGFCNPPYSQPKLWLAKNWDEVQKGFKSVFYIPTPNGEDAYRDYVFGKASKIIFINGRVAHIAPEDFVIKGKRGKPDRQVKKGDELAGNSRGNCFVIYDRDHEGETITSWIDRDVMRQEYQEYLVLIDAQKIYA